VPLSPLEAAAKVESLYGRLTARRNVAEQRDAYYRGKQPLTYASDEWRKFHADRYAGFSDNWCGVVADSPAERLRVDGFRLDDVEGLSDAEKLLWRDWSFNDMEAQSSQGFLSSIVTSSSAVLVWGNDSDEPVYTWEHSGQMVVVRHPATRQRTAALKSWVEGDLEMATLYTVDEVWKFKRPYSGKSTGELAVADAHGRIVGTSTQAVGVGSGWSERRDEGDDAWPIPHDLGEVPVVDVPNRPMLDGEPMSDIAGTMAMQDAVNALWAYLFTAADYASMTARVVLGAEPPKIPILDADGNIIGSKPAKLEDLANGRLLFLPGANGAAPNIDQWDSAKLDVFTDAIEVAVGHIAAQTRTPQHYLIGKMANLSADALKAAETGLVKKVEEQQLFFGPAMRDVFRLGALVRGDKKLAEACRAGKVLWKDAENRSDAQRADALLKKKQIGYPLRYLLEQDGLNPTEIDRVMAMVEAERSDPTLEAVARELAGPVTGGADDGDAPVVG
jgi:hypothetical protein